MTAPIPPCVQAGLSVEPWDDHGAMAVFARLDVNDQIEAQMVRGAGPAHHIALFADWRAARAAHLFSFVLRWRGTPFAVCALAQTGAAGVAQAALLSRDHARFRRALALAGLRVRVDLPGAAEAYAIRRVEARCWAGHPTAPRFLAACGFHLEARLPGFGEDGRGEFLQFARLMSPPRGD